jgi:cysteinyl-tRNA synthetase
MANVWMHNGFLQVEGDKMSKSLGNFVTIRELLESDKFGGRRWPGEVLRLAMLKTHYRQPIDWTLASLDEAFKAIERWTATFSESVWTFQELTDADEVDPRSLAALYDDLNTPEFIAELHKQHAWARRFRSNKDKRDVVRFFQMLRLIGLEQIAQPIRRANERTQIDQRAETLITARLAARRAKNFAESDRIRDELAAMGVKLKDGKDPVTGEPTTTWEVAR